MSRSVLSHSKSLYDFALIHRSPRLLILAISLSVFISNAVVIALLRHLKYTSELNHYMLDSGLQAFMLLPALVILVFRPLHLNLAQRRAAEQELAAERNKLREILDALPVGIFIVNPDYHIAYFNPTVVTQLGLPQGRRCHDYVHNSPVPCSDCRLAETAHGHIYSREVRTGCNGKTFEVFETPLHNADGSLSKLTLMRDITARKLTEGELQASRERLRSLSVHQQQVREAERTAVSREIHDELGQVLASIQLGVSSLAQCRNRKRLAEKVAGMEKLLTGAIRTVQRISTELRPPILDELGLAEAIEWQVAQFRTKTGIDCVPDLLLQRRDFGREPATAVFRILQEALTNVIRHSGASRVTVLLEERNGRLVLLVADNGRGITRDEVRNSRSLGITGIRERAYALGGRVRWCGTPQRGTFLLARIPFEMAREEEAA